MSPAPPSSSILFESADHAVVVVDVPRSIEEAQEPQETQNTQNTPPKPLGDGLSTRHTRRWRLASAPAPTEPFAAPQGPNGASLDAGRSLASQLAELTTKAAVEGALCVLKGAGFGGPWCLPRHLPRNSESIPRDGDGAAVEGERSNNALIPPGARFLHGTIADCRDEFVAKAPRFGLIVLDPPWPNRSARRRRQGRKRKSSVLQGEDSADRGYDTALNMDALREMLEQIPVGSKLAAGGIVAMWITNKPTCEELLTDPKRGVFRAWGVELVATWTWLKVTARGEPIVPTDSHWRRPWERLLLAQRPGRVDASEAAKAKALPTHRVIVGVPDVHSRKPHLRPLLSPFLPATSSDGIRPGGLQTTEMTV
ncbi:hypothetical protein SCUCBS95973_006764 [Sporothrix curviconia]|uniref:MT-A70-domain-containing protein n=1 Tax=Sporothrix curviconia TaxID=1260050 RepID=A0ABP0C7W4_9PEZI